MTLKKTSYPITPPPPPLPTIYIHSNVNHTKLIDVLKDKYNNAFQAKYTSDKLKIMFANINDFFEFKTICLKENIEYHTYTNYIVNTGKTSLSWTQNL